MKKIILVLFISIISLSADYKLVLTDVDGNQTQECVKSYSFSNNLESIVNQSSMGKDVYSEEEVITNKVYFGKPVYRKSVKPKNTHSVQYIFISNNIENVINIEAMVKYNSSGLSYYSQQSNRTNYISTLYDINKPNEIRAYLLHTSIDPLNTYYIVEYTKTTDTANTSPNKFQSYLHYKLSSSTNDEVITKDIENLGIQLLKGYSYDSSTNSCTKN